MAIEKTNAPDDVVVRAVKELADAAERFCASRGETDPFEVAKKAAAWSFDGWGALAREQGVEQPYGGRCIRAVDELIERCRGRA